MLGAELLGERLRIELIDMKENIVTGKSAVMSSEVVV